MIEAALEPIKDFVKNTLGCACPDTVFDRIETTLGNPADPYEKNLLIGDRLLIYVRPIADADAVKSTLPALLVAGRRERDARALNRFRAVLVTTAPIAELAHAIFNEIAADDERMHLHVIDPALVDRL